MFCMTISLGNRFMLVLSIVRATLDHGSLACLLQQCSVIFVINFPFLHERWIIIVTRNDKTTIFVFLLIMTLVLIYRLTHSASELSGFTSTPSLTTNEKFQYHTLWPSSLGSLSTRIFETRMATGREHFAC